MKKSPFFFKLLSVNLVIILFTNSTGYAKEPSLSNDVSNCGEWKIENPNSDKDKRISIKPRENTDENCFGIFTLHNETSTWLGGGYTLELTTDNPNTQFKLGNDPTIPLLIPGVDIEIVVAPANNPKVNVRGNMSMNAFAIDLGISILTTAIALSPISCVVPSNQIFAASVQSAPSLYSTAQLVYDRKFIESEAEFKKVINVFLEKSGEALLSSTTDCVIEVAAKLIAPPLVLTVKIIEAYAPWLATVISDFLKYEGAPVTFTFVYTSPASTILTEKWIAFINQDNLWLIHPDGSGLTPVTTNGGQTWGAVAKWSPDGKTLAYTQKLSDNISIILYDVQTSTNTKLITGIGGGFDWSLTGKQIIYDTPPKPSDPWSDKGLWVINVENGNTRQVVPPTKNNPSFMEPEWSSEGGYVLFSIPAFEPAGYGVSDFGNGKTIDLPLNPNGGIGAGNCEWAPSELIIACITVADESNKPELRLLGTSGTILEKILLPEKISGNSIVFWSPDAEKLAISYLNIESFNYWLDILSLSTKNTNTFSSPSKGIVSDWSQDGEWILSWDGRLNLPPIIYLTNAISGNNIELTEGMYPVWQP